MGDQPKAESPQTRARLLSVRERFGAVVAGVLLGGGGGAAVFLTNNQAGSTALVLVGAVFVLLGIQGTPVTRASKDSVELASRPEEIAAKAKEIAQEDDPKGARAFLEGAVSADPKLRSSPEIHVVTGELYEMQVRHALEVASWDKGLRVYRVGADAEVDFAIGMREGSIIANVVIKYSRSGALISFDRLRRFVLGGRLVPVLFVSNSGFSKGLTDRFAELRNAGEMIESVRWASADDNEALSDCLDRLLDASKRGS